MSNLEATLAGIFPVLPTIYTNNDEVDHEGITSVVSFIANCGARGVVFPGLASEYDRLTEQERLEATAHIGSVLPEGLQFIVGASATTPELSIRYALQGASVGAQAAMIMTPHQLEGDLDGLIDFYQQVGAQCQIPIMLQNAPKPMGIGLSIEDVATIVEKVDAVKYVKEEATPAGQRISDLLGRNPKGLLGAFGGAGARHIMDELGRGALGSMPACEISEVHVAILDTFNKGDIDGARKIYEQSLPLLTMQTPFRWRLTKAVLLGRGIIHCEHVRAPGPVFDDFDRKELAILVERLAPMLIKNT